MIFWTADQHFMHEAIIDHCKRPFKNSNEQTKIIIEKHNSTVGPRDIVYHLGDIFWGGPEYTLPFKKLLGKLNGTHILILGNHDNLHALKYVDIGFKSVHTSLSISMSGYIIIMAHDPSIWNAIPKNSRILFFHGHIHNVYRRIKSKRIVNVGVDVWDFYPIDLIKILDNLNLEKKHGV